MRRVVTVVPAFGATIRGGDVVNVRYRSVPLPPPRESSAAATCIHATTQKLHVLTTTLARSHLHPLTTHKERLRTTSIHCAARHHGVREAGPPPPRLGPRARSISHRLGLLD
jgi:hypothetical protein